jgi:hypothetical protein
LNTESEMDRRLSVGAQISCRLRGAIRDALGDPPPPPLLPPIPIKLLLAGDPSLGAIEAPIHIRDPLTHDSTTHKFSSFAWSGYFIVACARIATPQKTNLKIHFNTH